MDAGRNSGGESLERAAKLACRVALLVLLVLVGRWVVERTTWYLAIDQFGYLTFARDLASGRVFHAWELEPVLAAVLPSDVETDVLAQTYVRLDGRLHCRYAPGFPLLLAAAVPFGETAVRSVNLVALLGLLVCLYGVGRRLFGAEWQGLTAALLACLLPSYLLLWSISPLRDVPAHLFALAGLWTLAAGLRPLRSFRVLCAGVLLGFTVSIRVDGLLYLLPAVCLAWRDRPWPARRLAAGLVGLAIGLLPILVYNSLATGNPLRPTQFMEIEEILSRVGEWGPAWTDWLPPWSSTAHAAAVPAELDDLRARLLQGGGLKLRHLERTLPANLAMLREVFGDLGLALVAVGVVASFRRPVLFAFTVPYVLVATLFFSLWTRPDPRYLAGVILLAILLLVHGACTIASLPARGRTLVAAVCAGAVLLLGETFTPKTASALPLVTRALEGSLLVGLLVAVLRGPRNGRRAFGVAVTLALTAVLVWRSTESLGFRARFQAAEVERARRSLAGLIEQPALIVTRSDIGRPAENINYYTGAHAIYEQELQRWDADPIAFANAAIRAGFATYFLMPPHEMDRWRTHHRFRRWFEPELIARIPAERAAEFFVASPVHGGIPLQLFRIRIRPEVLERELSSPPEPRAPASGRR